MNKINKYPNHKLNCQCPPCKNKRGEKHKVNCKCGACKAKCGELKGKNNPSFIDGRTLKEYKCEVCGKKISRNAKRCCVCASKKRNEKPTKYSKILTKEFLIQEYIKNKKPTTIIAKEINFSDGVVLKYLKKYNIPIRKPLGITLKKYFCKINGCGRGISFHTALYGDGTCESCANRLKNLGRKRPDVKERMVGKNNPSFIDGRTMKKYYCIICGKEVKYSTALYGKGRCEKCYYKMFIAWNKNIPMSEESKQKLKNTLKEQFAEGRKVWNKNTKGLVKSCNKNKKYEDIFGKERAKEIKEKISLGKLRQFLENKGTNGGCNANKGCIKKGEHRSVATQFSLERLKLMAKQGKFNIKPNKPEKRMSNLLNILFPKEYKYTGDFKFWVENFNPDFINVNGQKKIIEVYGYYHTLEDSKKRDKIRLKTYKKYGYNTLVVWISELRDIKKISNRLLEFHNAK
jgi:hypothetical protein